MTRNYSRPAVLLVLNLVCCQIEDAWEWSNGSWLLRLRVLSAGGAVVTMLGPLMRHPEHVIYLLGMALPRASTFFIAYIIAQALLFTPLRLLLPHLDVIRFWVISVAKLRQPTTWAPKSVRHSQVAWCGDQCSTQP